MVGRRPDGYHLLQTVFLFLDHGDSLTFELREDGDVVLETPLPGVPPERDLTVRAARLLQQSAGVQCGVNIRLEKRLPMGGGLGGGSSNAATTLLALNQLWEAGLSRNELEVLGLKLGADVPIFVHGHAAFAEGVGEVFTDVVVPEAWYLVLVPPVSVPTLEIFAAADLCRDTPVIPPEAWQPGMGHNDMEPVAVRLYPVVGQYLNMLKAYGMPRMSGSGACVFTEFAEEAHARAAQTALPDGVRSFVARGLTHHPLLDQI
jgi:4-diphosphocytidyl-2-C-methyl-D-erythritol kinase